MTGPWSALLSQPSTWPLESSSQPVQLLRDVDAIPSALRGGAVSIGNFDGVHRGHARIVERLRRVGRELAGPAVVFSFDPHPVRLLRPEDAPPPLTWSERKAQLLSELGIDALIACRTDEQLLSLSPEEFFERIVRGRLQARAVVEGPNFCFGRQRSGNVEVLRDLCGRAGLRLEIVEPLQAGGEYVSSSRVRQLLREGRVDQANACLTRPYRIRGMVTHGDGRGAAIGFPTANLEAIDTLLPAAGVYAGRGMHAEGTWAAAIHVGPLPTFGQHGSRVEVHLLGFRGSLYGTVLEVDFVTRLRDIQPFPSAQALQAQLARDAEAARRAVQQTDAQEGPSGQRRDSPGRMPRQTTVAP